MYKVTIIYTGTAYESEINNIWLQELLGKIKIIGIGTTDIYVKKNRWISSNFYRKYFTPKLGLPFSCVSGKNFVKIKKWQVSIVSNHSWGELTYVDKNVEANV